MASRDWSAIDLGRWKERQDSLALSAEILIEEYARSGTIPPQHFSALFRNAENHCRSHIFGVYIKLPKHVRDELRADIGELFETRRMSYEEKYQWLVMFSIYLRDTEDLVWTCLGGF